jgi:hypothetical protein
LNIYGVDLSSGVGKPPEKPVVPEEPEKVVEAEDKVIKEADAAEDESEEENFIPEEFNPTMSSDEGDIEHDDGISKSRMMTSSTRYGYKTANDEHEDEDEDEVNGHAPSLGLFQKHFYIDVPAMTEEEKEEYEYLPGHFAVDRILAQRKDKRYNVLLQSGERIIVSLPLLHRHRES